MADGIALGFDGVSYPMDDLRRLLTALGMPSAATRARAGVRAGGGLEVTVGGSPESAQVAPGAGVITDTGAGVGSWVFVIPSSVSKTLTGRPAAGQSRLDEVVARINTTTKEVEVGVLAGSPTSGTPAAPTVPAGNLVLAELVVPASGSVTVQKPGRRTAALGGILPVASQAERDAIEVIYDGLMVYREDTDRYEGRANGAWLPLMADAGWQSLALTGTSGWTVNSARYRLTWPRVELDIQLTRTGATISAVSTGNVTDVNVATGGFPSAILPGGTVDLRGARSGVHGLGFQLSSSGTLSLTYSAPGGDITTGLVGLTLRDSYVLG
jgi:hypothetical protein